MKLKIITLTFLLFLPMFCHVKRHEGGSLSIQNNSSEIIYFWYSGDYERHHYPDTLLPTTLPLYINMASPANIAGAGPYDPDWDMIFSELPEGQFSVYFFESYPEDQQVWDEIRLENNFRRIETSLKELISNHYLIHYPEKK